MESQVQKSCELMGRLPAGSREPLARASEELLSTALSVSVMPIQANG